MKYKRLKIPGRHLFASDEAKHQLKEAEKGKYIELDILDAVDTDSVAIKKIIRLYKKLLMKGGDLRLLNVHSRILTILEACRLDHIIHMQPYLRGRI